MISRPNLCLSVPSGNNFCLFIARQVCVMKSYPLCSHRKQIAAITSAVKFKLHFYVVVLYNLSCILPKMCHNVSRGHRKYVNRQNYQNCAYTLACQLYSTKSLLFSFCLVKICHGEPPSGLLSYFVLRAKR